MQQLIATLHPHATLISPAYTQPALIWRLAIWAMWMKDGRSLSHSLQAPSAICRHLCLPLRSSCFQGHYTIQDCSSHSVCPSSRGGEGKQGRNSQKQFSERFCECSWKRRQQLPWRFPTLKFTLCFMNVDSPLKTASLGKRTSRCWLLEVNSKTILV